MAEGDGSSDEPSWSALASRIASGDRAAEAALVCRLSRALRFIVARRTGDPEIIDDVVQETFRIALPKLRAGELRDGAALPGFLHGIAMNVLLVERRRERHLTGAEASEALGHAADASPNRSPDRAFARLALVQTVRRLIQGLTVERDRELILRHYVLEHDKADICRDLGLSPEHFDRVLYRARERLRAAIHESAIDVDEELYS
jgi:RNA polymerase sigma-70 factor (ECF subfamily)